MLFLLVNNAVNSVNSPIPLSKLLITIQTRVRFDKRLSMIDSKNKSSALLFRSLFRCYSDGKVSFESLFLS